MFIEEMKLSRRADADEMEPAPESETTFADQGLEALVFEFFEEAKSWVDGGRNRLVLDLPGASAAGTELSGKWEALVDESGQFQVATLDAFLGPLSVPVHDPATGETTHVDSGRISVSLADQDVIGPSSKGLAEFRTSNTGRIDRSSGEVETTWSILLNSPALAEAGVGTIPVTVRMIGCFDPHTEVMELAGVGEVTDGPLHGTKVQISTAKKMACSLSLIAQQQYRASRIGKLTVRLNGTPKAPITVSFGVTIIPLAGTTATFSPKTVTLKKNGDTKTVDVTFKKAKPPQDLRFRAMGGGKAAAALSLLVR